MTSLRIEIELDSDEAIARILPIIGEVLAGKPAVSVTTDKPAAEPVERRPPVCPVTRIRRVDVIETTVEDTADATLNPQPVVETPPPPAEVPLSVLAGAGPMTLEEFDAVRAARASGCKATAWPPRARALVLELAAAHGIVAVSRATGISTGTIWTWQKAAAEAAIADSSPPGPAEPSQPAEPPPASTSSCIGQEGGAPGPVDDPPVASGPMTRHEFDGEKLGRGRGQLWSERAKAFAVSMAVEIGDGAAARELGLNQPEVSRWRREAGLLSPHRFGGDHLRAAASAPPAEPEPEPEPVAEPNDELWPASIEGELVPDPNVEKLEEDAPVLQLVEKPAQRRRRDIGHGTIGNQKPPAEKSPKSGMQWDCPPPRPAAAGVPLPEAPETVVVARQQCSLCSEVVELEVSSRMPETEKALALHKAIGEHQHARHEAGVTECIHGLEFGCTICSGKGRQATASAEISHTFTAKFSGHCRECDESIDPGDRVARLTNGAFVHEECA